MANQNKLTAGEKLTKIAEDLRKKAFAVNEYNPVESNDGYDATHKNANSDGDNKGMGNASFLSVYDPKNTGTQGDILNRTDLIKGNEYTPKNQYYTATTDDGTLPQ
tara:strand:- start:117 stop:434 length:318 start_codon:yes stop_codon:yes gene_type:complete